MNTHMIPVDINHITNLTRLIREVEESKTPRKLLEGNKAVAILMPVGSSVAKRHRTNTRSSHRKASIKEVLSLAGAWSDLPDEHMEEELDRIRHANKPPPDIL